MIMFGSIITITDDCSDVEGVSCGAVHAVTLHTSTALHNSSTQQAAAVSESSYSTLHVVVDMFALDSVL